ncbi:MAG: hypothetical protein H7233_15630, partial [Pseudorhodobacter sp.]|nr:hypothetical protein [Frankiaceae bacterium]
MTTAAARSCVAAFAMSSLVVVVGPALAHEEGLTPYRYVTAPAGVASAGVPDGATSTAPLDGALSATTPDTQVQLTVLEGGVAPVAGESQLEVVLAQLDPAALPALPGGLVPEGNAYRVAVFYAGSGAPVLRFAGEAVLSISAPALPTAVLRLEGERWVPADATPLEEDARIGSVVKLPGPGTYLQAYDPATAPATAAPAPAAASATPPPVAEPAEVRPEAGVRSPGTVTVAALVL